MNPLLKKCLLYFHTLRYLKIGQIVWRVRYRFGPRIPAQCYSATLAEKTGQWQEWRKNGLSYHGEGKFTLLNLQYKATEASDWNDENVPKLALYNLHYFDGLNSPDADQDSLSELVDQWIAQNPVDKGNGWEPYPLSLRMVNWVKWWMNSDRVPSDSWIKSLSYQMSALEQQLEYHILGNHLFANAKAMVFSGCYLKGLQASRCLRKGKQILIEQLKEQVLKDGGHFELSPMYHGIILEDILDLINLGNAYPNKLDKALMSLLKSKAVLMLDWYRKMSHENGEPAFFNDSANGIAKPYPLLRRYGLSLDILPREENDVHLKHSGYISYRQGDLQLMMDVANVGPDYLPGHAHADTLSLELSLGQQKLLVNSGTSEYGISEERQRQRGTAAHSTLAIRKENSSEVWGGFRVARRARVKVLKAEASDKQLLVEASHNGYRRLKGLPVHKRRVECQGRKLTISDQVSHTQEHAVVSYHLHPDVTVNKDISGRYQFYRQKTLLATCKILHGEGSLEEGSYHPEFGVSVANQKLMVKVVKGLSCVEWFFPQQMS